MEKLSFEDRLAGGNLVKGGVESTSGWPELTEVRRVKFAVERQLREDPNLVATLIENREITFSELVQNVSNAIEQVRLAFSGLPEVPSLSQDLARMLAEFAVSALYQPDFGENWQQEGVDTTKMMKHWEKYVEEFIRDGLPVWLKTEYFQEAVEEIRHYLMVSGQSYFNQLVRVCYAPSGIRIELPWRVDLSRLMVVCGCGSQVRGRVITLPDRRLLLQLPANCHNCGAPSDYMSLKT